MFIVTYQTYTYLGNRQKHTTFADVMRDIHRLREIKAQYIRVYDADGVVIHQEG
jgi:hypothetical protein